MCQILKDISVCHCVGVNPEDCGTPEEEVS